MFYKLGIKDYSGLSYPIKYALQVVNAPVVDPYIAYDSAKLDLTKMLI